MTEESRDKGIPLRPGGAYIEKPTVEQQVGQYFNAQQSAIEIHGVAPVVGVKNERSIPNPVQAGSILNNEQAVVIALKGKVQRPGQE